MIKKLSMIVLGMMVMGFCMAAVPQDKAEAKTYVWNTISHYPIIHGLEQGQTWCRDVTKDFTINQYGLASKGMGWFSKGGANVGAKMKCGKSKDYNVKIPRWGLRWYHFWLW